MTESEPESNRSDTESDQGNNESFRRHWETLTESSKGPEPDQSDRDETSVEQIFADFVRNPWLRAGSAIIVILVISGVLLYTITGTWPVAVGVESSSMEPNIAKGDLIVLQSAERSGGLISETNDGIRSRESAKESGVQSFGDYGSVIVFQKPGGEGSVIHRVHLEVEKGENWAVNANESALPTSSCQDLQYCPAPNDGYITKGDANQFYDQINGGLPPIDTESIVGIGWHRIPFGRILGFVV